MGEKTKMYTYYKYPFVETLEYANVSVFELKYGQEALDKFDKSALKYCSPVKRERENTGHMTLIRGNSYVIIPATEKPGCLNEFFLSIYVSCPLRDVEIRRTWHTSQN